MALVKETGAIVAGANVYATLAEADLYHEDRGNTSWDAATEENKEAALLRAGTGIESKYRERWIGFKSNHNTVTAPQFLAWPRKKDKAQTTALSFTIATMTKLTDFDGIEIAVNSIPIEVQHAFMEIALVELTQPFVSTLLDRDNMVKYERVDVIETEFFRNAPAVAQFPHIDGLLSGLASTAPVKLGADIGLTDAEQDGVASDVSGANTLQSWLDAQRA